MDNYSLHSLMITPSVQAMDSIIYSNQFQVQVQEIGKPNPRPMLDQQIQLKGSFTDAGSAA